MHLFWTNANDALVTRDRTQQIHRRVTQRHGDRDRAWMLVKLSGRSDLFDATVVHHRDHIGQTHRFLAVVRDVNRCSGIAVVPATKIVRQFVSDTTVKRR